MWANCPPPLPPPLRCLILSQDLPFMRRWGTWWAAKIRAPCPFTRRSCWEPLEVWHPPTKTHHAYKLCQTTTNLLTLYEQDSLADLLERQPTWWTSGKVISFTTYLLRQLCWSQLSKKKHGTFLSLECRMTWNCPQNWGESELVLWNFRWMKNLLVPNVLLKQKAKMPLFAV